MVFSIADDPHVSAVYVVCTIEYGAVLGIFIVAVAVRMGVERKDDGADVHSLPCASISCLWTTMLFTKKKKSHKFMEKQATIK